VTCTHCGTEIADRALICFKCGRPTADVHAPAASAIKPARKPLWPAALGLVVLVGAGLFMATATFGGVPEWLRWSIAGGAAILLVLRLARRMKR
jgi:hypothetical protein